MYAVATVYIVANEQQHSIPMREFRSHNYSFAYRLETLATKKEGGEKNRVEDEGKEAEYKRLKMRRAAPTATTTQEPSGWAAIKAGAMLLPAFIFSSPPISSIRQRPEDRNTSKGQYKHSLLKMDWRRHGIWVQQQQT